MRYVRVYAGADGESHFEDVDVVLEPSASLTTSSAAMPLTGLRFAHSAAEYQPYQHTAPRRQFVVTLSGSWEVTTSDGETRRFDPGSVALFEDTTGKGHINRVEGATERLFSHLD